jgi:hypothetical protein
MTGAELLALGHAAMARSHSLILLGGGLGLLSIVAGLISRRIGAPVLLVFLAIGMLAGDEHVLGVPFDDFGSAYLIGSVALASNFARVRAQDSGLDAAAGVLACCRAGHHRCRSNRRHIGRSGFADRRRAGQPGRVDAPDPARRGVRGEGETDLGIRLRKNKSPAM